MNRTQLHALGYLTIDQWVSLIREKGEAGKQLLSDYERQTGYGIEEQVLNVL